MKPVWETRSKTVPYTVYRKVWETHTREVPYTVVRPIWETRTKERLLHRHDPSLRDAGTRSVLHSVETGLNTPRRSRSVRGAGRRGSSNRDAGARRTRRFSVRQ